MDVPIWGHLPQTWPNFALGTAPTCSLGYPWSTGVWKLIVVSPVDTVSFFLLTTGDDVGCYTVFHRFHVVIITPVSNNGKEMINKSLTLITLTKLGARVVSTSATLELIIE